MNRRKFTQTLLSGAAGAVLSPTLSTCRSGAGLVPPFLAGREAAYRADPKRSLLGWFAEARFGLFLYYSLAADWRHPYFYSREAGWENARPNYPEKQPEYRYQKEEDFKKYIAFARNQIREIVTQYKPAGIWFDPVMGFYARPDLFPMEEIYAMIRQLRPATLISFKQGATGTEDFAAPERAAGSFYENTLRAFGEASAEVARRAGEGNRDKHNESCNTMQPHLWGYRRDDDSNHLNAGQVLTLLREANSHNMNLLLNTGPLPEGDIHPEDVKTLREVGKNLAG